jgi:hypothetical protein
MTPHETTSAKMFPFRACLWKEYRRQRTLWFAVVALSLMISGLAIVSEAILSEITTEDVLGAFIIPAIVLSVLYAYGSAGMLFAVELEEGTYSFLRRHPIPPKTLFLAKVTWTTTSTLGMGALIIIPVGIAAIASGFIHYPFITTALNFGPFTVGWLLWSAEAIAWGILFSLLMRRALGAVALAMLISPLLQLIIAWVLYIPSEMLELHLSEQMQLWWFYACRTGILCLVFALDVRLGLRWYKRQTREASHDPLDTIFGEFAWSWSLLGTKDAPRIVFRRLCIQHIRQSQWILKTAAAASLFWVLMAGAALLISADDTNFNPLSAFSSFVAIFTVPSVLGLAFYGDQHRRSFRFLTHHGVSPRQIWWSRQAIWAPVTLVMFVSFMLLLGASIGRNEPRYEIFLFTGYACLGILHLYATGLFCSLSLRSGLLAVFATGILAVPFFYWCLFMSALLGLSLWWTALPIPFAIWIGAWLHVPDWMVDRKTWRSRLRLIGPPLGTIVVILLLVPPARIYQIPGVDGPGFDVEEYLATARMQAEDVERKDAVERIGELIEEAIVLETVPLDYFETEENLDRLEEIRIPPSGRFDDYFYVEMQEEENSSETESTYVVKGFSDKAFVEIAQIAKNGSVSDVPFPHELGTLIYNTGLNFASQDRWDEVLDAHEATLKFSYYNVVEDNNSSFWLGLPYYMLTKQAREYSRHEPEWFRRAIQIVETSGRIPIESLISERKERFIEESSRLNSTQNAYSASDHGDYHESLKLRLMPWERKRCERIHRYGTCKHLQACDALLRLVEDPSNEDAREELMSRLGDIELLENGLSDVSLGEYEQNVKLILHSEVDYIYHIAIRLENGRLTDLSALAVRAYQADHNGELPPSIESLVGEYLEFMPLNAYTGEPFEYLDWEHEYWTTP